MDLKALFLIFSVCFHTSRSFILFRSSDFKGESWIQRMSYENQTCITLPLEWQNVVSSIIPDDICLELYSDINCNENENKIIIGVLEKTHIVLSHWNFDKRMRSLKVCDQYIDNDMYEERPIAKKASPLLSLKKKRGADLLDDSGSGDKPSDDESDEEPKPAEKGTNSVNGETNTQSNSKNEYKDKTLFWGMILGCIALGLLLVLVILTLLLICMYKCKGAFCCTKLYVVSDNI